MFCPLLILSGGARYSPCRPQYAERAYDDAVLCRTMWRVRRLLRTH